MIIKKISNTLETNAFQNIDFIQVEISDTKHHYEWMGEFIVGKAVKHPDPSLLTGTKKPSQIRAQFVGLLLLELYLVGSCTLTVKFHSAALRNLLRISLSMFVHSSFPPDRRLSPCVKNLPYLSFFRFSAGTRGLKLYNRRIEFLRKNTFLPRTTTFRVICRTKIADY